MPSRLRFSSSLSRHRDVIDDGSDEGEIPAASEAGNSALDDDAGFPDLRCLEHLQGSNVRRPTDSEHDPQRTKSLPRKRRRISGTDKFTDDAIAISSSPSPELLHSMDMSDDEDFHTGLSDVDHEVELEKDTSSSPIGPSPAIASTRFRMPTPAAFHTPVPSARLTFKLPQVQAAAVQGQSVGSSLPDAFSPSRRRGKKDYIPGGAADTVRSWILALAAQESNAAQAYTYRFRVVEMRDDGGDGRCVLVKDESCRWWLLINEGNKAARGGNNAAATKVTVGSLVGIKDSSVALNLRLDHLERLDVRRSSVLNTVGKEWSVGIIWDVLE